MVLSDIIKVGEDRFEINGHPFRLQDLLGRDLDGNIENPEDVSERFDLSMEELEYVQEELLDFVTIDED